MGERGGRGNSFSVVCVIVCIARRFFFPFRGGGIKKKNFTLCLALRGMGFWDGYLWDSGFSEASVLMTV